METLWRARSAPPTALAGGICKYLPARASLHLVSLRPVGWYDQASPAAAGRRFVWPPRVGVCVGVRETGRRRRAAIAGGGRPPASQTDEDRRRGARPGSGGRDGRAISGAPSRSAWLADGRRHLFHIACVPTHARAEAGCLRPRRPTASSVLAARASLHLATGRPMNGMNWSAGRGGCRGRRRARSLTPTPNHRAAGARATADSTSRGPAPA
jgi:hypothetical protein